MLAAVGGLAYTPARLGLAERRLSSVFGGIQIGVQTYSFRDRSLDAALEAILKIGISSVELLGDRLLTPLKNSDEPAFAFRADLP